MSLITIEQLLESVDLDFKPEFVTKQKDGLVVIWSARPKILKARSSWEHDFCEEFNCSFLKLAEFDGKDWTECIYEVPRKTDKYEQNLDKLRPADSDLVYRVKLPRKTTGKIEKIHIPDMNEVAESAMYSKELAKRLNQVIDAVNELKERTEPITLNPDLTDEDLRKMMRDPRYWRDKDSATIQKVQNGFNKLYGDKN